MRQLLFALALLLVAPSAYANTCVDITEALKGTGSLTDLDISAGAATTGEVKLASARQVLMRVDLTDADNSVTALKLTFTESRTSSGTFGKVATCDGTYPDWTCKPWSLTWDPSVDGKELRLPLPIVYLYFKTTVTPTGNGAGDEVDVSYRACY